MDYKQLWQSALLEIELQVSKPTFATWFKDTHIVKIEDGSRRPLCAERLSPATGSEISSTTPSLDLCAP
jgi:hypothetical protein